MKNARTIEPTLRHIKLIAFAESMGGTESLMTYPAIQTHADIPEEIRRTIGVDDRLLRFSVGLEHADDILPLWVADMDFEPPKEVVEAIKRRAEHGIYGYTMRPQSYYDAIVGWLSRRHGWRIEQDWLSSSPGVLPALSLAVQSFTQPGDGVILQSPVYYPFYDVIRMNGWEVVNNPLILRRPVRDEFRAS